MAGKTSVPIEVAPCEPAQLEGALALLYRHLPPAVARFQIEQALNDRREGRLDLGGLLRATHRGRLLGVLLAVEQPGKTAMVWPPTLAGRQHAEVAADALISRAAAWLASRGVRLAQAMLDPSDRVSGGRMQRNGFANITDLLYLDYSLEIRLPTAVTHSRERTGIRYEPYSPERHRSFAAVVEETYRGSLDCPQLEGLRPIEEVLEGHRCTGRFDPRRWLLAAEGERPVGCLLLTEHTELRAWEVVYMGVVPSARGRGLGRELTLQALRLAGEDEVGRVLLAVDVNNYPARKVYSEVGFRQWDRRSVHMRILTDFDTPKE